ncbi:hypothetical protein PCASD_10908 [Puccinia coronata f. sp. avenae]|uniref:Uncharacterized protein n=1 Tax=Puccinia coronata f. sp. avenae TaxID=200324 RepID=A0A2N5U1S2_9BASI|nr:hypothetical protein PCASD_10908 [Puccinia coronata f. sp. avenae]
MFFSRFCDFLRITIAIYFLSNGRVAIAPNADEANCIDQASSLLKRPSSSNDGNPQKQEWYSASQTSHSDGSSGNPPDGGWPRILPPNHDGIQLDLPGNRNQIPIDDPNHVVIDPPFQIVVTGSIRNADMPREQITAWEHHFSHFIEFYWAPSTRKPIRQPSSTTFSNWPAATVSFIHRNSQPVELIIPLTSDGKIYEKSSLVERITELQKWLLYTHKIVLQLLHPELKPDDWIDFHRDLVIKWFFEELFKPTHGLPVFGLAKPIDGANEPFGRLQSYVFKLLQNKASVSMASVAIVGSWHKRRDHAAWQYLFNNDHEFWEAVVQSMIREANDPINDESNIHLTLTLKGHPASTVGTSPGGPSSCGDDSAIPVDRKIRFRLEAHQRTSPFSSLSSLPQLGDYLLVLTAAHLVFSGTSPFSSLSSLPQLGDYLLVLTAAHLVFSGTSPFSSLSSLPQLGDYLLVLTAAHLVFSGYEPSLLSTGSNRLSSEPA